MIRDKQLKGVKKMKQHRARIAKCIDDTGRDHRFIEVEPDRWLEVAIVEQENLYDLHRAIHHLLEQEQELGEFNLGHNTRAFAIGIIRDWQEAKALQ